MHSKMNVKDQVLQNTRVCGVSLSYMPCTQAYAR